MLAAWFLDVISHGILDPPSSLIATVCLEPILMFSPIIEISEPPDSGPRVFDKPVTLGAYKKLWNIVSDDHSYNKRRAHINAMHHT